MTDRAEGVKFLVVNISVSVLCWMQRIVDIIDVFINK